MSEKPSIALIGAGNMGGAMLAAWLARGVIDAAASAVFDPQPNDRIAELCRAHGLALNPALAARRFDVVVLAVKPQLAGEILPAYAVLCDGALVISIMAGTSIAHIASLVGDAARVVRAMPNLPAAIEKGASGVFAPATVRAADCAITDMLLGATGEVVWVESEAGVDFVTAISGSGPAYFFLLAEALAEAGAALGLDADAAARLARATLSGAGAFVDQDGRELAELRAAVTSPGGTTAAALGVFDGNDAALRKLVRRAAEAAARRASELTQ